MLHAEKYWKYWKTESKRLHKNEIKTKTKLFFH